MTLESKALARMQFLARVIGKECKYLVTTDRRLFAEPFTSSRALRLSNDPDLAEQAEAFVGRFGRLQDTLGDKFLPLLLTALGEKPGAALDNLDRAERLGLIESSEHWLVVRQIRNQMVHEYIEDMTILADALQAGHANVPILLRAADAMIAEMGRRGWNSSL